VNVSNIISHALASCWTHKDLAHNCLLFSFSSPNNHSFLFFSLQSELVIKDDECAQISLCLDEALKNTNELKLQVMKLWFFNFFL
jgi:hypothetical protein